MTSLPVQTGRRVFLAALLGAALAPLPGLAHGLSVFASVTGDTVTVEAKFSSGRPPVAGDIRVFDSANNLVLETQLLKDGSVSFPLMKEGQDGLRIEVKASDGHENYWLLTPADIKAGQED